MASDECPKNVIVPVNQETTLAPVTPAPGPPGPPGEMVSWGWMREEEKEKSG